VTHDTRAQHNATKALDNPLWIYALNQYRQPECAQFLLHSQDKLGLNINILLFIGWLASSQKQLNLELLQSSSVYSWQQDIIKPIRAARKKAKSYDLKGTSGFYQRMLDLELDAEKLQLSELFCLSNKMDNNESGGDKINRGDKAFTESVRLSCELYLNAEGLNLRESWLQTLIQHLQPNG